MTAQQTKESFLSKRRLKWAGIAAFLGCAACCALPFLALLAAGGGAATATSRYVKPGSELIVGGAAFVVVISILAVQASLKKQRECGPSCRVDGTCCVAGPAKSG
jgi:hypothetical protein